MSRGEGIYTEFTVYGLGIDPGTKQPVLVLQDLSGQLALPIWIGPFEAAAIASAMEEKTTPRPMIHDLLKSAIERLGARVERLDIDELADAAFKATLVLVDRSGGSLGLDCRPSDGAVLALVCKAPIRLSPSVLAMAQPIPQRAPEEESPPGPKAVLAPADDEARQRLAEQLEALPIEDFGKYKM